jgi:peroxiredoxin
MFFVLKNRLVGKFLLTVLLTFYFQGCSSSIEPPKQRGLDVGDKLLDFSLMDENGQIFKYSSLDPGWYLVIVFYRGAYCNACRTMLFDLKDNYSLFPPLHATFVAISTDSLEDSYNYNNQWRFPFPLLSDPSLRLIDAFGDRHPNGHGIYDIAHPATVIIDPQKIIRYKKIGQNPEDLPNAHELAFLIQSMEAKTKIPQTP